MSDEPFEEGDEVHITFEGRTVDGTVLLASPNNKSLVLGFQVLLGAYVGMMPVFREKDDDYVDLLYRRPVVISHRLLCPHGRARSCEECGVK